MFKFNIRSRVVINTAVANYPFLRSFIGKTGTVLRREYGNSKVNLYWVSFEEWDFEGLMFYENELLTTHNPNLPNLF